MSKQNERMLPEEGIDFSFLEPDDLSIMARSKNPIIGLRGETYRGIIVQYGKIEILIEETPPRLAFDYTIINPGDTFTVEQLKKDDEFKNLLGDIISSTLNNLARKLKEDESRDNNPQVTS